MRCIVAVQSQLCGALTFSSMFLFTLPASKNQSCHDIRLRPTVHKLSVSALSDANCHPILQ